MFGRRRHGRHFAEDRADADYDNHDGAEYDGAEYDGEPGSDLQGDDPDLRSVEYTDGPFDEHEAPDDELPRLDLGSVKLPMPPDAQVQVEMDPAGPLKAVHLVTANARLTVSAYAAPRSAQLWPEIHRELADQLSKDGARVRKEIGDWGVEIVAFVNDVLLRFIGVDGPRWMLRAVAAGPKEQSAAAAAELRDVIRDTVVIRGEQPMPVRTPLEVKLPPEIATHIEQLQAGQAPAGQ